MSYHLSPEDYETAEQNGIPRVLAFYRFYNRGWSKERAITQPLKERKYLWNQYKNISVVTRTGFYYRVSQGMSPEKAATTPSQRKGGKV
jgi:hypothetical protein